ncbi:AGE family epimerase/isomerase [Asticcacaulis machinosus]|uniref:Cellobiose 2-epimerase n=1 Tax=Asticcacaulis machinosus TaxID=2984211 RepID=A0ABT5HH50_9CAUL|nr:AGE family epimerase/isomerase [Asticcacaulis machinosus]MDC7675577.1 AGE family epimerase/isomerase [Asticcacaulis machinosus]
MTPLDGLLHILSAELEAEAERLFAWWSKLDGPGESFAAEVDLQGRINPSADHSIILATRLLWYFSAHGRLFESQASTRLAHKAAAIIRSRFWDKEHGGLIWALNPDLSPKTTHKQAYAQAFGAYAFAEYYALTRDAEALSLANHLFNLIERHYRDAEFGGYTEALSARFERIDDQRLSDKDLNAPKSMNTHLHVLEAYTRLHQIAPRPETAEALAHNIDMFLRHIIDDQSGHLRLFFKADWTDLSHHVSFGHDIEASWLLFEAADVLGDDGRLLRVKDAAVRLAELVSCDGISRDGGIYYEAAKDGSSLDMVGEWWGQAEGLVGFLNAFELTGEDRYLGHALAAWRFVATHHKPKGLGEWTWYPAGGGRRDPYLAGAWKCPYHNGRAMMEALHRLDRMKPEAAGQAAAG